MRIKRDKKECLENDYGNEVTDTDRVSIRKIMTRIQLLLVVVSVPLMNTITNIISLIVISCLLGTDICSTLFYVQEIFPSQSSIEIPYTVNQGKKLKSS